MTIREPPLCPPYREKKKNENCTKPGECQIYFFFPHVQFLTSITAPPFSSSPPLPSAPLFLFSPHCIPVMTNVKHSPQGGWFFFFPPLFLVTKNLPSRTCAGTRLLRKHHIGASASDISVKVTEMFEGVVTSSQVPAVCVHLREIAPSHPFCLHPPHCCF